jgi:polyisoprenyl-teichoic acid--peptidoglycan teichoic acid transferase
MMGDQARRSIRRVIRAKRAISPKVRGQYRRQIHAARLSEEAKPRAASAPEKSSARSRGRTTGASRQRRTVAPWVYLVALLPVLLLTAVGAYTINVVQHTQRALDTIVQPTLPRGNAAAATTAPRPTNTANPLGTIEPVSTDAPTATVDPIAAVHFDRKDPFTMMLIGVDAREGDTTPQSDTIILVYIDPSNPDDTVHMMSIPRDLRVTIAGGFGVGKMADVYALGAGNHYMEAGGNAGQGGVILVRDTIEQNFRIQLDFYAQVDFGGLVKIVDAVGGVTVDNPYPIRDNAYPTEDYQYSRVVFPAGTVHLDGPEALEFARTRHDDDDYGRNARQQQVLLGIRQQALQLNLLSKATDLIDALGSTVKTDFPPAQWLPFAKFGVGIKGSAIRQIGLNDLYGNTTINGIFYTTIDWTQAQKRAKEFSPKENKDYIAAQANGGLNKGAAVVVENGTNRVGIASAMSATLHQQGYANASFIDAPAGTKGAVPKTQVLYFAASDEKTAQSIAATVGLPTASVNGQGQRPPGAANADIVVLLGDDAPG